MAKNNRALIQEFFSLSAPVAEPFLAPDFNVAPSKDSYVVTAHGQRLAQPMRWGLVPSWAKDVTIGNRLINARLETVAEKPSFRSAFRKRRCLVVADGFYEWQQVSDQAKQPYFIHATEQPLLAMAGIFELENDLAPATFSILTTEASPDLSNVHHRMPVMVPPGNWQAWLDAELQTVDEVVGLLPRPPQGFMTAYPVSREVNSVRNNSPELLQPLRI